MWSFTRLHFPEFIRIIFILYMFFILNFLMPHCDAASLATPAVVSHEGRLRWRLDHGDGEILFVKSKH